MIMFTVQPYAGILQRLNATRRRMAVPALRRAARALVVTIGAGCLAAHLAAQAPIPRYEVRRAPSPITIDGRPDEKAWAASSEISLIFPWEYQTGEKQTTRARLLWDDAYLYVAFECADTEITAQFTERDDPTYRDDAAEIFVNPKPSQTGVYFGFEMNARAALYDYLAVDAQYLFWQSNPPGIRVAAAIDGTLNVRGDQDRGWSLEAAIPWRTFEAVGLKERFGGRPNPGEVWTANLNRWDGAGQNRRLSIWSDPLRPKADPHAPERFGQLVFVK